MTVDIEAHFNLVRHIVNRYRPDDDDLFQVGCIALWRAAQRFDPSRGVAFSTYAGRWIENAVRTELARQRREQVIDEDIGDLEIRDEDASSDPEAVVERRAAAQWLREKLMLLTPKTCRLVLLWAQGTPLEEIARASGLTEAQVSSRVSWALRKMREAA